MSNTMQTPSTVHEPIMTGQTWVAVGPAGALGSVHGVDSPDGVHGFTFKLMSDDGYRGVYPSLEVAQSALYASLLPGSDWPEFRAH